MLVRRGAALRSAWPQRMPLRQALGDKDQSALVPFINAAAIGLAVAGWQGMTPHGHACAGRWQGRPAMDSRAVPEAAESTGRGEDWKIEAEASPAPTEGHALEQALTEQVEEGPAGGVADDLAQTSARHSPSLSTPLWLPVLFMHEP